MVTQASSQTRGDRPSIQLAVEHPTKSHAPPKRLDTTLSDRFWNRTPERQRGMQDREVDHSVSKIDQTQARSFVDALGLGGKAVFGPPGSRKGKAQHLLVSLDQPWPIDWVHKNAWLFYLKSVREFSACFFFFEVTMGDARLQLWEQLCRCGAERKSPVSRLPQCLLLPLDQW
jgi:hypothetical protein